MEPVQLPLFRNGLKLIVHYMSIRDITSKMPQLRKFESDIHQLNMETGIADENREIIL